MKERIIKSETLTNRSQKPYSKYGEKIMATDSGQEMQGNESTQIKTSAVKLEQLPQNPPNLPEKKIINNEGKAPTGKSIKETTTEDLKTAYKRSIIEEQIAAEGKDGLGSKEKIAADAQERNRLLIQELEARGIDVKNLFLEVTRSSGESGRPVKSVGAATAFDATRFNAEADGLKTGTTRQEFRNYIDLAKTTSVEDMPHLWKKFSEFSQKLNNDLYDEYVRLGDTAAEKTRKTGLEAEMQILDIEQKEVFNLMEKKVPAEAKSASQEQVKLINEIKRAKEALNTATTDAEKNDARLRIREAANSIYDTILHGDRPPEDSPIPDEVMEAIGTDGLATEKFIHRLIFMPIENEQHHMSGFYSQSNLDKFLKINKPERIGKERYDRLKALIEANQTFHNMNYVLRRSFDQFSQLAQSIQPEQFEVLSSIPGVSAVFHMYERYSQEHLGIETRITQKEFDKMDNEVESLFEEINKEKILAGMEGSSLTDWEAMRALAYGRNLFRITVRAAEHISHSELPGGLPGLGDLPKTSEVYISPPQKELAGILNYIKFTVYRFKPNEEMGGFELIDSVRQKRMKKRRDDGKVRLKTVQGTDVDMRSLETIVSARGYMYTWRMREALLKQIKFKDAEKMTSVADFFTDHKNEIATISTRADAERLFKPMLEGNQLALGVMVSGWAESVPAPLKTLLWEKISALDPLVMSSLLTRVEADRYDKQKAKGVEALDGLRSMEEIILNKWGTDEQKRSLGGGKFLESRAQLRKLNEILELKQKEIKDMEHPFAADTPKNKAKIEKVKKSARYERLKEEIKTISVDLDKKRIEYAQMDEAIKDVLRNDKWEKLKDKFSKAHEKRILWDSSHMGEPPKPLSVYLEGELALSDDEKDVYKQIQENGKLIASDLANFSQATTWFMDDVPLPLIKWSHMGQTYDRMVNDLGAFQKSNGGLGKIIAGKPFNEPPEEIAKHFAEAISEEANVVGLAGAAQDNYYDLIKQYLDMIQERRGNRALLVSEYKHARLQPTSRAQEITRSMKSAATDEVETFDVVQHLLSQASLRGTKKTITDNKDDNGRITYESQVEEVVKNYHIGFWDRIIKRNIIDYSPIGLIALLIAILKRSSPNAKAGA